MTLKSKVTEAEKRLQELIASVKIQEHLLDEGSKKIFALNDQYNDVEREYKMLLRDKERLSREVATLAENLDLFSDN